MTSQSRSHKAAPAIGLALAGGAPSGAIYEIGALRALDEALVGFDLRDCGYFVGVSAGAFLTSCLANGLSTAQQVRAIVKPEPGEHPFVPETFFQPAVGELGRRLLMAPNLLGTALRGYFSSRDERLLSALTVMGQAIPVGVFANGPIRDYVRQIFAIKGRTDDFRQLDRNLTVVATDLESGEPMLFGHGGRQHIPISTAVQASTALPGFYPPVEIEGRHYVDGILLKTMHASAALEQGAELVFCINPLVPVDTRQAVQRNELNDGEVTRNGLPSVLSQTVRTLIHSRLVLGVRAYEARFPDADVVLIEPSRDDHEDFFSNIFSFDSRAAVCERAYHATRQDLAWRRESINAVLERHGLRLDDDFLDDPDRDLWRGVGLSDPVELAEIEPQTLPTAPSMDELTSLLDRVEALARKRLEA